MISSAWYYRLPPAIAQYNKGRPATEGQEAVSQVAGALEERPRDAGRDAARPPPPRNAAALISPSLMRLRSITPSGRDFAAPAHLPQPPRNAPLPAACAPASLSRRAESARPPHDVFTRRR